MGNQPSASYMSINSTPRDNTQVHIKNSSHDTGDDEFFDTVWYETLHVTSISSILPFIICEVLLVRCENNWTTIKMIYDGGQFRNNGVSLVRLLS